MGAPRLLDLFCCEGGATRGYQLAGWHVTGVDIIDQPRYCGDQFHQGDALKFLAEHGSDFDAIHASPPCHDHNALRSLSGLDGTGDLLDSTRRAILAAGKPYVLENVPGAPMTPNVVLCGSMFGLRAAGKMLRRHRLFETSAYALTPPDACAGQSIGGVYGTGGGGQMNRGYKFRPDESAEAMGIDWMSTKGRSQALPPAYTEFLGHALMAQLSERAA